MVSSGGMFALAGVVSPPARLTGNGTGRRSIASARAAIAYIVHGHTIRRAARLIVARVQPPSWAPSFAWCEMSDILNRPWQEAPIEGALELPEEVLQEVRLHGFYDEISVDPNDGRVLGRIHLRGTYDSYSDTYILNGRTWKIESRVNLPGGRTLYCLVPENEEL